MLSINLPRHKTLFRAMIDSHSVRHSQLAEVKFSSPTNSSSSLQLPKVSTCTPVHSEINKRLTAIESLRLDNNQSVIIVKFQFTMKDILSTG